MDCLRPVKHRNLMPIDNCKHSFDELASKVLPGHFEALMASIESPVLASEIVGYKSATKTLLAKLGRSTDFPGCYAFLDEEKPIYVGISRSLIKRLTQHLNHDSHYSASLVYKMATEDYPHEMKRDQAMKDDQFREVFFHSQQRLQAMRIAFIEVQNDLELYVFEVYASMRLDTNIWNTFRTH